MAVRLGFEEVPIPQVPEIPVVAPGRPLREGDRRGEGCNGGGPNNSQFLDAVRRSSTSSFIPATSSSPLGRLAGSGSFARSLRCNDMTRWSSTLVSQLAGGREEDLAAARGSLLGSSREAKGTEYAT